MGYGIAGGAINVATTKGDFADGYRKGVVAHDVIGVVIGGGKSVQASRNAKEGVYITMTTAKKIYVGQTNNFSRRAGEHARTGKINRSTPRLQVSISIQNRNFIERLIYTMLGGKNAPWLENKISPPRR